LSGAGRTHESDRYLQTFFVQHDLGSNLLTGYEPVAIAVPRNNRGRIDLTPGSTYQVVSEQPEIDPDILRRDRTGWVKKEYGAIPLGFEEIRRLTSALTKGAENDFDKASAITSYLQNLKYDTETESPLTPSTDLKRFVIGELPGPAIDFASALTLMARSAGLQSRIATGYLPASTTRTLEPAKSRRRTPTPGRKSTSAVPVGYLSMLRPGPTSLRLPISSRPLHLA